MAPGNFLIVAARMDAIKDVDKKPDPARFVKANVLDDNDNFAADFHRRSEIGHHAEALNSS